MCLPLYCGRFFITGSYTCLSKSGNYTLMRVNVTNYFSKVNQLHLFYIHLYIYAARPGGFFYIAAQITISHINTLFLYKAVTL